MVAKGDESMARLHERMMNFSGKWPVHSFIRWPAFFG